MPKRFKTVAERWAQRRLHPAMPISRMLLRSHWEIGLVYLAGYVLLDWISFIHPIASFGITPWNPPPALSLALILLFGPEFLPWLFTAPLLADALVRQFPLPIWAELVAALLIGFGYGAGALVLTAPRLRFDVTLASKRDLLCLVALLPPRPQSWLYLTSCSLKGLACLNLRSSGRQRCAIGSVI